MSVYPNPAKDILNVMNMEEGALKVYDVSGRLVKQHQSTGAILQLLNIGDLRNGLYLVRIENAKGTVSKKIVIQN